MAKKEIKKFEFSKIGTILDNISKSVSLSIDKNMSEGEYISTGSLVLNAALSGSIFKGIGTTGITVFAGPEATGKTLLALNTVREAQRSEGYGCIWIDTEHAINRLDISNIGVDNSLDNFYLVRGNQVEDINIALTTLIGELKKAKLEGYELPKQIWVLDSLAQLSSRKMKEDLLKGDIKAEVGNKAKAIGSMLISITEDLSNLGIPFLVNNQVYETMEMFSQTVMKGGKQLYYSANNIVFLSKAKLKEDNDDLDIGGSSGIIVTAKIIKNRRVKPKQVKFEISFNNGMNQYKGLDNFCRPEFFDKIGLAQGKMEVDKKTGEMLFMPGAGNRWYVRHLDKHITYKQLFTKEVFTKEVLEQIDLVCQDYFKYKSFEEAEEMEKRFNKMIEDNIDDDGFSDSISSEDLFS
jgi:RecA/RadA recombinase